jgi:pimeloyl-ACP methyl ester carboxylesterase
MFIVDVTNRFEFEDLHDVVLAGHSVGGTIVPHVALRVPDRIRRVVFVAGAPLRDGETVRDVIGTRRAWLERALGEAAPASDLDLARGGARRSMRSKRRSSIKQRRTSFGWRSRSARRSSTRGVAAREGHAPAAAATAESVIVTCPRTAFRGLLRSAVRGP